MGREVKRVALDFSWPMGETYSGFLMPDDLQPGRCPDCDGTGSTPFGQLLSDRWYGRAPFTPSDKGSTPFVHTDPAILANVAHKVYRDDQTRSFYESMTGATGDAMVTREAMRVCSLFNSAWSHHLNQEEVDALAAKGRLTEFTHRRNAEGMLEPMDPPCRPTAAQVNAWSIQGMGHDSFNQWIVADVEAERLGMSLSCATCDGEGTSYRDDAHRAAHDAWEPAEPPSGDGWQMWENTSEGSPISPVKHSPEALARWLADTRANAGGGQGATYEQWLDMINAGWAPVGAVRNGEFTTGVAGMSEGDDA